MKRTTTLIASSAALTLAALVGAPAAPGPPAAAANGPSAGAARGSRLVLSPHRGEVVRSHHLRLRVRSRRTSGALRVRLNGVRLEEEFGRPHRGVRTLRASISHGLRRGRNVLRVGVRRHDGSTRRAKVRFFVRSRPPLVGAGRDRRVAVGATIQLTGHIAPATRFGDRTPPFAGAPGKGGHSKARSRVRWKVVRHPRGGHAPPVAGEGGRSAVRGKFVPTAAPAATDATASAPASLTSPAGLTPGFAPLVPGRYALRLTVGRGDDATSDRVTLKAVPPDPLVPIDTRAGSAENPGIKIGETLYPASGNDAPVQVVVLDRDTLAVQSNTSYPFVESISADLATALSKLNRSQLVVVAQFKLGSNRGGSYLNEGLASIGAPKQSYFNAAIGVPGYARGDADVGIDLNGGLNGYLTPDQYGDYGFVPSRREPFSYKADPQPPCDPGATACDSRAGFKLHVQDESTLASMPHDGSFYNTNGRDLTDAQRSAEADRMASDINDILQNHANSLVTIETVTTRFEGEARYRPPVGAIGGASMKRLAEAVASIGGTRNAFNLIATKGEGLPESGGLVYTLVGWAGAGEGEGAEAAAGVNGTPDVPALTGVLRPDRQSRFRPEAVSTEGGDPNALTNEVMQPPSDDWPLDGKPGPQAAISYLGERVKLGPDPRLQYWTADWTQSDTNKYIIQLQSESFPGAGNGFSEADFEAARDELILELRRVGTVLAYMDKLARPFTDNQLQSWTQAHEIADDVYKATRKPEDETTYEWLEFTKILLELAAPLTEDVTGGMASLMDLGMWIAGATEKGGAPSYDEFNIKANEVGGELVDQAAQTAATYERIGDIILSDPEKLEYFGDHGGCDPVGNDKCPDHLAWGKAQRVRASAAVYRGIERLLYQKLMPLGYHVFQLNPSDRGVYSRRIKRTSPPDIHAYECTFGYHVWSNYKNDSAAATSLLTRFDPSTGNSVYTTLVMSQRPGAGWQHGEPPPADLLGRMFDPVTGNDPTSGGLGMVPQLMMANGKRYFWEGDANWENKRCFWDY